MFKLVNYLVCLCYICVVYVLVGFLWCIEEVRDCFGLVKIELQLFWVIDDVLQNQIVNGSIGVFIFGVNVEQIVVGNVSGMIVKDVQFVVLLYQYQFVEFMGMFGKDILWVVVCYCYCLCGGREKFFFM